MSILLYDTDSVISDVSYNPTLTYLSWQLINHTHIHFLISTLTMSTSFSTTSTTTKGPLLYTHSSQPYHHISLIPHTMQYILVLLYSTILVQLTLVVV